MLVFAVWLVVCSIHPFVVIDHGFVAMVVRAGSIRTNITQAECSMVPAFTLSNVAELVIMYDMNMDACLMSIRS